MYPGQAGGDIGNLLRLIQEEKAGGILNQPPAAQPGAPIRGVVQQPLQSPNDPGSARVISTPAEGVAPQGQANGVIAPVPVAPVSSAVAPVAPTPGRFTPSAPSPSATLKAPASSGIKLGTSLSSAPAKSASAKPAPAKSSIPTIGLNKNYSGSGTISAGKTPPRLSTGNYSIGGTVKPLSGGSVSNALGIGSKIAVIADVLKKWLKPRPVY